MFDLTTFCDDAHRGKGTDQKGLLDYLKSFHKIILWGAGNLGTAVGGKLREWELDQVLYWDTNAEHIGEKNGYAVIKPFTQPDEREASIVIFCIANVAVGPTLYQQLISHGWTNIMKGTDFLEGVLCPFSTQDTLDAKVCNSSVICSVCSCSRLDSLMQKKAAAKKNIGEDQVFSMDRIHFIVNNFCNLKCMHCFMYMNSYRPQLKRNVLLNQMERDIAMLMEAVDSFGVVNVFGGEPFLHPEIGKIIDYILKYDNFGSLIMNTNGMAHVKEEQTEGLKDKRVRLAFSNYLGSIDQEKERIFCQNIEALKQKGITVTVNNKLPSWNISSTLGNNHISEEEKQEKKRGCGVKFLYVHNGKVFPCSFCFSICDLGIADYTNDYIDMNQCESPMELREKLKEMLGRPCYDSCGHCDACGETTSIAGEQGYDQRYRLPKEEQNV